MQAAFAALLLTLLGNELAPAAELTPTLPQTIHRGRPAGAAPLRGVDWARTRRAELPAPRDAAVLWQRRLPGGLTANALVDAAGRVFVAGHGRVLQLGPDGREEYTRHAEFTRAVTSALLADGQRVVLTREGTLWSWSARGAPGFMLDLRVPPGWTRGDLLSLPEGGVLASAGVWLFQVSARGELQAYARLQDPAVETLISADQIWIVTEPGGVWRWSGRSRPDPLGSFAGRVSTAALRSPGRLLAVIEGRELAEWSLGAREPRVLGAVDGAGAAARLSISSAERAVVLGSTGNLVALRLDGANHAETTPESQRLRAGPGELLTSADALAWFVPHAPLTLQRSDGEHRAFAEVACAQPSSLVPAGARRVLAACRSGQLWLIGPAAPEESGGLPEGKKDQASAVGP